jgi:hypothetical protein
VSSMLDAGGPGETTAPRPLGTTAPCTEAVDRVLATAADLAVTGRRIDVRHLALLTWLEPETIEGCLDHLCRSGRLVRVGPRGQQFTFPKDRWPPPEAARAGTSR